jgi:16S rRNA (uracil1498-N3)-methyltransferase
MHRFYLSQIVVGNTALISDTSQLHHLKDVLRLKIGDEAILFDRKGVEYLGRIKELSRKQASLSIKRIKQANPAGLNLTIACALPKKSRMDDIVDKLTQLGVDSIIPFISERVITKPDEKIENKLDRWRKIALNASEQSQRSKLPDITPVLNFKHLLTQSTQYGLKLIPTLEGPRLNIREIIPSTLPASILTLIGPEGDFSPEEIDQAMICGFTPVSLGENVLRVDTAAIAVASYLRFSFL